MFERCIYFNLNALVRDLNKIWEAQFTELGLTPPLGYMFAAIMSEPGLSQKELSKHLHLERSTVTRFLDSLEDKGLIRREAAANDARVIQVYPTEKGKTLRPKLSRVMKKLDEALDGKVSISEVEGLLKAAARFRERLTE